MAGPIEGRRAALLAGALGVSLLISISLACQKNILRFPHREHLGLACGGPGEPQCLSCLSCHGAVAKDREGAHPEAGDCLQCHRNTHRVERTLAAPATAARKLAETIAFDHGKHLQMERIGGQCIACHSGVVSESSAPRFPPMSTCFQCHEHQDQWDEGRCGPCHQQTDLDELYPQTFLKHGPGWDRRHGTAAANTTVQCARCHTKESCDDCHDVSQGLKIEVRHAAKVDRDFIHPADFLTRHAMEAASEPARCLSCHRTETCDSCHMARGVSAGRQGAENPHPPGWMGPDSLSPNHHGRAARRDILACAACHDQGPQTNCIDCHKVGEPGGNPHPNGWRSSRTPNDMMCNYCHEGP